MSRVNVTFVNEEERTRIFENRCIKSEVSNRLSLYGSTVLVDLGSFFSFLIYTQPVGLLGRWINQSQGCYLHTEQHEHRINAHTQSLSGIRTHDPRVRAGEES
jgi:hypothetical protein